MSLTKEQLEKYFKDNTCCPYCGSACIMDAKWKLNKGLGPVRITIFCDTCEAGWDEEYEMVAVDGQRLPVLMAASHEEVEDGSFKKES